MIREHGDEFRQRYAAVLSRAQTKALRDLAAAAPRRWAGTSNAASTAATSASPTTRAATATVPSARPWPAPAGSTAQAEYLLPVEYYHVVFTLPAELSELALANPTTLYDLLFQAAAATLREVAANPKRLGRGPACLLVLHTWGQNLHHHPHVHGVVTGGGLSCNAAGKLDASPRWVSCRPGFFLPVRVLEPGVPRQVPGRAASGVSAGRAALLRPTRCAGRCRGVPRRSCGRCTAKDWVVYAKPPFGGPAQVLKYLARYTHRVAISNHRLVKLDDGRVTFRYKDYADAHRHKTMTLDAGEFLRRFVQHVLPAGFVKIRHYGLLANRFRAERLAVARGLLWAKALEPLRAPSHAEAIVVEPVHPRGCERCGSPRLECVALPTQSRRDTS